MSCCATLEMWSIRGLEKKKKNGIEKKRQLYVSHRKNEVGRLGLPPLHCPTIIIMAMLISHVLLRPSLTCLCHAATLPLSRRNSYAFKFSYRVAARGSWQKEANQMEETIVDADKLRADFLRVLRSRRSGEGAKLNSNAISLFSVLVTLKILMSVLGSWEVCEFVS